MARVVRSIASGTSALEPLLLLPFVSTSRRRCTWMLEGIGKPEFDPATVFIAPSASVVGNVTIGSRSSVWYNCVLRGDVNQISIGEESNIQDGTVVHVARNNAQKASLPTKIGNQVTVGHMALLHA